MRKLSGAVSTLKLVLMLAALPMFLSALAREADAGSRRSRPLKTGLTMCWSTAGVVIDCAGTGQDGELQRGEPRSYLDLGDGTIRDRRTGLMWEKLSDDDSVHDKDDLYLLTMTVGSTGAFEKIQLLNTPPCFAGFCDWRLPNLFELETLRDMGRVNPAVSAVFNTACAAGCSVLNCSCTSPADYWTSSTSPNTETHAWIVGFLFGDERISNKGGDFSHVRAVRSGS